MSDVNRVTTSLLEEVEDDALSCVRGQATIFEQLAKVCEEAGLHFLVSPVERRELAERALRYRSAALVLRALSERMQESDTRAAPVP
jgi:hypothetical protein